MSSKINQIHGFSVIPIGLLHISVNSFVSLPKNMGQCLKKFNECLLFKML